MPTVADPEHAFDALLAEAVQDPSVPGLPPLPVEEPQAPPPPQDAAAVAELKPAAAREVAKSYRTTLQLRTDLPKSSRDSHPSGILHFARTTPGGWGGPPKEEHAFAWIAQYTNPAHVASCLGHMERFGFEPSEATFIPYSSRRAWVERYPLAFPHVYCGEDGGVSGFPFWSAGGGNNAHAALTVAGGMPSVAAMPGPSAKWQGRKKKKIAPAAHLPNEERDELHVEMYKYLKWLKNTLASQQTVGGMGMENSEARKAGIDAASLDNLLGSMEATFKVVRHARPEDATGRSDKLPFLEAALAEPLGRLAEAVKKDPKARVARTRRGPGLDFEALYDRLLRFRQTHGHVNVPQKYAQDGQLGSWVANIRSKRKQMAKRGEEFELDVPADEEEDDGDDLGLDGEEGKRRKHRGGRQRLTRERIHRLDSIGFQWTVANPNTKSWEERFEDLKEYQHIHGTTRVPRSSGTLGEWVHMQRRLYNKKDKNFLSRRAPLLDDIGFEWQPRKHALVSWEDNFHRLVEFGRVNRHYNVVSPFPEGYIGDYEGEDGELVEAHRFHKWVKRIHAEYRSYATGRMSRMLNDARVMQLREIGFQFQNVPEGERMMDAL